MKHRAITSRLAQHLIVCGALGIICAHQAVAQAPLPGEANPGGDRHALFQQYDTNQDGVIDEDEFSAYVEDQQNGRWTDTDRGARQGEESYQPGGIAGGEGPAANVGQPQSYDRRGLNDTSASGTAVEPPQDQGADTERPITAAQGAPLEQPARPGGAQSIYQAPIDELKQKRVSNTLGEEIGSVQAVVVQSATGDPGLIISASPAQGEPSDGGDALLAPVGEVTINGTEVTWRTTQSAEALRESRRFDGANYEEVSAEFESLGQIQTQAATPD